MSFDCLGKDATQTGFASLVGVSQQAVSGRVKDGRLPIGGTFQEWLLAYCEDLREQAAGRGGDEQADFQRARAEDMTATAAIKRMTYHEKMKTLILKDEALQFLGDWAAFANNEFKQGFEGLAKAIEERTGEAVDSELKDKYAGAAITRVRGFALKYGAVADGSGDDV